MNYPRQYSVSEEGGCSTSSQKSSLLNLTLFDRMCPGRWLSYDSIWIAVASVLSVYNISAAIDDNGLPMQPSVEYTSSSFRWVSGNAMLSLTDVGVGSHPKPFKCRIVPRSEAAAALIKQTAEERA